MNTTQTQNLAEVMEKLDGIRRLAERGGTLAEAQAASAMMAKLLLKYNLTLDDVESHARKTNRAVTHEDIKTDAAEWKRLLLGYVAHAHLCQVVNHRNQRGNVEQQTVIGHAHNLIVVRETWLWLIDEVNRLCELAWADAKGEVLLAQAMERAQYGRYYQKYFSDRKATTRWKGSFRLGAVDGIHEAYEAMKVEARAEAGEQSWALVPVLEAEVAAYTQQLFPALRRGRGTPGYRAVDGYRAGVAAGRGVNLGRQVGTTRTGGALAG